MRKSFIKFGGCCAAILCSPAVAEAPTIVRAGDSISSRVDATNPQTKNGLYFVCHVLDAPAGSAWEIDFKGERPSKMWIARGKACDAVDSWDLMVEGSGGFIGTTKWSRARFISGGGAYIVIARFADGKMGAYTMSVRHSEGGGRRLKPAPALAEIRHREGTATRFASPSPSAPAPTETNAMSNAASAGPTATFDATAAASTGPRLALIIGNSEYGASGLSRLPNPVNDADSMTQVLRQLGFDVQVVKNADQKSMKRAIADFGERLRAAGSQATSLFFYAGHGMQSRGINYLVPIGAKIRAEADVDIESVAAEGVLAQMEEAGTKTNIVILDACRNMPLSRAFRSASRGLAPMDAPNGTFIAYSTAPGSVAEDGLGRNSPFVTALLENIGRRGEPIEAIFRDVRRTVLTTTEGHQRPWDASSLIAPFYFAAN